ncbi:amyloid-beta precursor protein-like [Pleurodeles waltl]|uniref:amyloid-beta precursor protein-like n=1 Tax=Pleurodeles waltl TaxID=8319 RepID=UPI0037094766
MTCRIPLTEDIKVAALVMLQHYIPHSYGPKPEERGLLLLQNAWLHQSFLCPPSELCVISLHLPGFLPNYPSSPSYPSVKSRLVPVLKFSHNEEEEGRELRVVVNTNDPEYEHVYTVEDYNEGPEEEGTESTLGDEVIIPTTTAEHERAKRETSEEDRCYLPMDEGTCSRYTLRWYYNQNVGECRPFIYSGCHGNLNKFDSQEDCDYWCKHKTAADSPQANGNEEVKKE